MNFPGKWTNFRDWKNFPDDFEKKTPGKVTIFLLKRLLVWNVWKKPRRRWRRSSATGSWSSAPRRSVTKLTPRLLSAISNSATGNASRRGRNVFPFASLFAPPWCSWVAPFCSLLSGFRFACSRERLQIREKGYAGRSEKRAQTRRVDEILGSSTVRKLNETFPLIANGNCTVDM